MSAKRRNVDKFQFHLKPEKISTKFQFIFVAIYVAVLPPKNNEDFNFLQQKGYLNRFLMVQVSTRKLDSFERLNIIGKLQ